MEDTWQKLEGFPIDNVEVSYVNGNWQSFPVTVRQGRNLKLVQAEKEICRRGSPASHSLSSIIDTGWKNHLDIDTLLATDLHTLPPQQSRRWRPPKISIILTFSNVS